MTKLEITKALTDLVVSTSVATVVFNAIAITTPPGTKFLGKLSIGLGGVVLSNMVGDFASMYVRNQIDEGVTQYYKIVNQIYVIQEQQAAD